MCVFHYLAWFVLCFPNTCIIRLYYMALFPIITFYLCCKCVTFLGACSSQCKSLALKSAFYACSIFASEVSGSLTREERVSEPNTWLAKMCMQQWNNSNIESSAISLAWSNSCKEEVSIRPFYSPLIFGEKNQFESKIIINY